MQVMNSEKKENGGSMSLCRPRYRSVTVFASPFVQAQTKPVINDSTILRASAEVTW